MAEKCIQCNKTIGRFSHPIRLDNNELFCEKCKEHVNPIIDKIWGIESIEEAKEILHLEFDKLREYGFSEESIKAINNYCISYAEKRVDRLEADSDKIKAWEENVKRKEENELERIKQKQEEYAIASSQIANYMITTGYNFDGYKIIHYDGVISGQTVLGTGFLSEFTASFADFFGEQSNAFANKLELAKNAATEKLIKKSIVKGSNGLIGIDFDYITFSNNMIGVIANGTSVTIEKL